MDDSFIIKRILNNNVIVATHPEYKEVVLLGKGIGFGRNKGERIDRQTVEKWFILKDEKEKENYRRLLPAVDEELVGVINEVIAHIRKRVGRPLSEHIHVGLTDHISFTLKRLKEGISLHNPFLLETRSLYPYEYTIATEVIALLRNRLHLELPEEEAGFIALHIHSGITNLQVTEVSRYSQLIKRLVELAEDQLDVEIDRESIHYLRFVRHLRFAIERVKKGDKLAEPKKLINLLKVEYPICYNTAWKIAMAMQQALHQSVDEAEIVYLTLHLQRLTDKAESSLS